MKSFFATPVPFKFDIMPDAHNIADKAVGILNKMAEARYDGQNAKYVNNMQPEMDFAQDSKIVIELYRDGVNNIIIRLEPYIESYEDSKPGADDSNIILHMRLPETWKDNQENVLKEKINTYLVHYIIANWVEKVSMPDTEYRMEKAAQLLRDIKGVCELRKGRVHRIWNGTY